MHEAAIASNIITALTERLEDGRITGRIKVVNLRIGRLTAVVSENLRFLFEIMAQETKLAGATLAIEDVPVRAHCKACGAEFEIDELFFFCRQCNSPDLEIRSGRELDIASVEVEE